MREYLVQKKSSLILNAVTDSRKDFMGHSTSIDRHYLGARMRTYVRYECSHGDVIR
jgi:hypothetical protein